MNAKTWLAFGALLLSLLANPILAAPAATTANPPVAKLDQPTGVVEFSRDGRTWRPLTRAKYLFVGNQVRTGADGAAQILNQSTGAAQRMSANSQVRVTAAGVQSVRGSLAAAESANNGFFAALVSKFNRAQRYTTVRRNALPNCKVDTVGRLTVSSNYPEIVWRNAGPECTYRLTVGSRVFDVPVSSTAEMVRYRLPELPAGDHAFKVETVVGGVVNSPERPSTLHWLSAQEGAAVAAEEQRIRATGDDVLLASFFEDKQMLVPAMDTLRGFMAANPDENELRPLLIKTYADLRLDDLKTKEATAYAAANSNGG